MLCTTLVSVTWWLMIFGGGGVVAFGVIVDWGVRGYIAGEFGCPDIWDIE